MRDWKARLYSGSRDRRTLIVAAGAVAAISIFVGMGIAAVRPGISLEDSARILNILGQFDLDDAVAAKEFEDMQAKLLAPPSLDTEQVIKFFFFASDLFGPDGHARPERPELVERGELIGRAGHVVVAELLMKTDMDGRSRLAFDRYARAMFLDGEVAVKARLDLLAMGQEADPPLYANLLSADLLMRESDLVGAVAAVRREPGLEADPYLREHLIWRALEKSDTGALAEIRDSPEFAAVLTWGMRRGIATELRDYPGLFVAIFMTTFGSSPGWLFVSLMLVGTTAWFAILVGFIGFSGHRWWWFLLPVVGGALSVVPTIFIGILQEHINGLIELGELPHDFIYWIAGVGLREEVSKLLLFACFLPYLLKKRSPAHALITAACVGLGFAAEENISYFSGDSGVPGGSLFGGVAFARYVTSTGIHMFLTGIAGYALYWMCVSPKRHYEQFLIAFISAVVVHGMFDLLQSSGFTSLADATGGVIFDPAIGQWINIGIMAGCAYRFFDLADASRLPGRRLISPLGLFVVGGATVWGTSLMAACAFAPFTFAFAASGQSGLGVALVAWIFINRFRNE